MADARPLTEPVRRTMADRYAPKSARAKPGYVHGRQT